jgi:hypothetical protein
MKIALNYLKNGTRLAGGLLGFGLIILSLPFSLLTASVPQGEPFIPVWQIVRTVLGAAILLATGFIMFSLGWPRRFVSLTFKCATCVFLLCPLVVGCMLIHASRVQFPPVEIAIGLVAFTLWLLLLCIKPTLLE